MNPEDLHKTTNLQFTVFQVQFDIFKSFLLRFCKPLFKKATEKCKEGC